MMLYCCCAGPSFIISAVGVQMFGSFSVGVLLFAVQLGVSVLFALVCALHCRLHSSRPAAIADPHPVSSVRPLGLGEAFVLSVAQSVEAMGQMSGFIVLFSAVGQLISSLLPCASLARALLLGCLEVTNGCSLASTLPLGAVFASCFLSFGGLSLRVLATPGHTQGSVCYLCGGTLFSGDTLFDGDVGRTDLAESVPAQMAPSLAKLGREVPPEAQVLPGHESFTTMAAQLANNRWLAAACREG